MKTNGQSYGLTPPLSMEALYWDHTLSRAFYFQYGRAFIVTV
jgi:hypothetical protein